MLKIIGLIIAMILAIVLTIVVCLGGFALFCLAVFWVWNLVTRIFFPNREKWGGVKQTPAAVLRDLPHFRRVRQGHTDAITGLASLPTKPWAVSTSRDQTLRIWDMEWNKETVCSLPFYPGPLAVGDHDNNGLRVALGAFDAVPNDAPGVLVWEPMASDTPGTPRFRLSIPGLRLVHALAWDETAQYLRVFAGVFDDALPTAPDRETDTPNRLVLLQFVLGDSATVVPAPDYLPLPPQFADLSPWQMDNRKNWALSENGLFLACQTEYADPQNAGGFGVGVWDIDKNEWRHRFGGREAYPHDIFAVSRNGDRVYSSRQDEPGRDYRNGGQEWYDGLYVWDASSAPPEGQKEAEPFSALSGSANMAFNHDETLMANPTGSGDVEIYDMETKKRLQTIRRPEPKSKDSRWNHTVWRCAFCDSDRELITGHADGELWWWGVASKESR